VYGVHDGLLQDLAMNVSTAEGLDVLYRAAIARVGEAKRG
jgi:hypothetical protein